jgi:hypothetical protein
MDGEGHRLWKIMAISSLDARTSLPIRFSSPDLPGVAVLAQQDGPPSTFPGFGDRMIATR